MRRAPFSIYNTACKKPFIVSRRAIGDWAVGRFNPITNRLERWGNYATEELARSMARCVNREVLGS
jgi:hypothetical protein